MTTSTQYLPISPRQSSRPDYYAPPQVDALKVDVLYGRKSRETGDKARIVSYAMQDEAGDRLAESLGIDPTTLVRLVDEGRSGSGGKTHLRADYVRLKAMVEAGQVRHVLAYSLSRLGRNSREVLDLLALCTEHGVKIRGDRVVDQQPRPSSPFGKFTVGLFAMVRSSTGHGPRDGPRRDG
jgi:DNA invertase Pin-like site-specific DNA recombinase